LLLLLLLLLLLQKLRVQASAAHMPSWQPHTQRPTAA
jgi:hypothetical protein